MVSDKRQAGSRIPVQTHVCKRHVINATHHLGMDILHSKFRWKTWNNTCPVTKKCGTKCSYKPICPCGHLHSLTFSPRSFWISSQMHQLDHENNWHSNIINLVITLEQHLSHKLANTWCTYFLQKSLLYKPRNQIVIFDCLVGQDNFLSFDSDIQKKKLSCCTCSEIPRYFFFTW